MVILVFASSAAEGVNENLIPTRYIGIIEEINVKLKIIVVLLSLISTK